MEPLVRGAGAASCGHTFDSTTLLFFPFGTSLRFHTLNVGGGLMALPLIACGASLAAAYGLVWLATFFLSALGAALLGWRTSGSRSGALVAGLAFSLCPFRTAHAIGHLDLAATQWLPLTAALFLPLIASDAPRRPWQGPLAGLCLGLAAITSWYFMVYLGFLAALLLGSEVVRARRLPPPRALAWCAGVAALVVAPLAIPMLARLARGDGSYYLATEDRNPADLAGFFLPPATSYAMRPLNHMLTGGHEVFAGNTIEGVVGLGTLALLLAVLGWRRSSGEWKVGVAGFALLSLGPSLWIAGRHVPVPLPYALLRHVPVLRGARVPARFVVMVSLCMVPLVAAGVARLVDGARRPRVWVGVLSIALLVELAPFRHPTVDARVPSPYADMEADRAPGAVMDVPFLFQRRNMYRHTVDGRPLVGGWVARLDPRSRVLFKQRVAPVRDLLYRGAAGGAAFRHGVAALGARFVVVDSDVLGAPPSAGNVMACLGAAFPSGPWRTEGTLSVYRVDEAGEGARPSSPLIEVPLP